MSDKDTINALTQAVGASEAGRRVGWARAYSAEANKEDLSREINMLRAERDIMRRAASFLLGYFRSYLSMRGDTSAAQQALSRWAADIDRVMDPDVVAAGREAAQEVLRMDPRLAAEQAEKAAAKKQRIAQNGRDFKVARQQERKLLMKRYGFANEAAFINYLEQYGGDTPTR